MVFELQSRAILSSGEIYRGMFLSSLLSGPVRCGRHSPSSDMQLQDIYDLSREVIGLNSKLLRTATRYLFPEVKRSRADVHIASTDMSTIYGSQYGIATFIITNVQDLSLSRCPPARSRDMVTRVLDDII